MNASNYLTTHQALGEARATAKAKQHISAAQIGVYHHMRLLHHMQRPSLADTVTAPVAALAQLLSIERRRGLSPAFISAARRPIPAKIIDSNGYICLTTLDVLCYRTTMPAKGRAVTHPYEIEYKGKVIRCRDLQSMKSALAELEGSRLVRQTTPWTAEEFQKFTGRIHIPQRRLLAKLIEHGPDKALDDSTLRDLLSLADNKSLAGSLSGVSKVALMFGIEPRRVYIQNTTYKHARPQRTYQITAEFAQAAARHKWPSKDDLRDRF